MPTYKREEMIEVHQRYITLRDRAETEDVPWSALADFFTEDASYTDPAWGRYEGLPAIRKFLDESMVGLQGWTFPEQWILAEGDRIVTCWMNRLPGQRADGSYYEAPGISTFLYAGNGKFRRCVDLLNMVHVTEVIKESGWRPGPGFNMPPKQPLR